MTDIPTEAQEAQEAQEENPFEDELSEEASTAEYYGWIGQKTEGNFAQARPIIDRYMKRLQALAGEIGAITGSVDEQIATHEAEIEALKELRKTLAGDHEREYTRIRWMLEGAWDDFREPIAAILGRGKTWKLPNGSISAKTQQPVLEYDEEAAVAWVEALDSFETQDKLLKHTTALKRGNMKKFVDILPGGAVTWKATGEVLGFAVADVREDKITITPRPPAAQEE